MNQPVAKLVADRGVHMSSLGPDLLVPFQVRKVSHPALLWINERWFLEAGLNLSDPDIKEEVCAWLLRDFAFAVPAETDPQAAYGSEVATLNADRYGTSFGAWNGGSGRCGIIGGFNAKGIGRTPLVGPDSDVHHSNGMMYLSEAIEEAIASEIAQAELPFGAVPVVAIIDMGFFAPVPREGAPDARRAILVRPNFIRPAHFERSIFFGEGGAETSPQYRDALRVRDAVAAAPFAPYEGASVGDFLREMLLRAARQSGAACAHRLWIGPFTSSNRAIDGALADFGAFRAAASWRRFLGTPPEKFGDDFEGMRAIVDSLCFYFRKYSAPECAIPKPEALFEEVRREAECGFRAACAGAMGLAEGSADGVLDALRTYYERQQCEVVPDNRTAWRQPWLLDALAPGWRRDCRAGSAEREVAATIQRSIGADGADAALRRGRLNRICRWLTPRHSLLLKLVLGRVPAWVRTLAGNPAEDARRVRNYIAASVSRSRRLWLGTPPALEVAAQWTCLTSSLLVGWDHSRQQYGAWLSGRIPDKVLAALGVTSELKATGLSAEIAEQGGAWMALRGGREESAADAGICELLRSGYSYAFAQTNS